jgi:8-oxo-dGTP pyrophosphatase MutT (NUDIX family)
MPKEKSAGAIIYRMENGVRYFLLLHYPSLNRKGGHWEFPKGHVEEGENEEQTMRREIEEETGIKDLRIVPGFKEYIKYFFRQGKDPESRKNKKPTWIFKLVVFFIAETDTKDVVLSKEHIGFDWLPIDEAIKKTTFKNSKLLLKKASDYIIKNPA